MQKEKRTGAQQISRWVGGCLNSAMVGGLLFCLAPQGFSAVLAAHEHEEVERRAEIVLRVDPSSGIRNIADRLSTEDFRQINCLARNMYFEAATQGQIGMKATGDVVFNRLRSGLYPDSVCQVIYQGLLGKAGKPLKDRCQFSWYCDGKTHTVTDVTRWKLAYEVAYNMYLYREKMPDVTGNALRYHAFYVSPKWGGYHETTQIGAHLFYKPDPGVLVKQKRVVWWSKLRRRVGA